MTEEQARKAYDKMMKIEEEFGDLFTGLTLVHFCVHTSCAKTFPETKTKELSAIK